MLTETEKKWLGGKSDADYPAPCVRTGKRGLFDMRYCLRACEGDRASSPKYCPIASDYRDAAEFEARVALYMTKGPCFQCKDKPGPNATYCIRDWGREGAEACRLKHTRLAVEQEMEKEGK